MPNQVAGSDLRFYDIFALHEVSFSKIRDDVIAWDLWFAPPIKNLGYAYGNQLDLEKGPDTKDASLGPVQKKIFTAIWNRLSPRIRL